MTQLRNQVLELRAGDSYSGTITNNKIRFVVTALTDIGAMNAYLTVADRDKNVLFTASCTPALVAGGTFEAGTNDQFELLFVLSVANTIGLPRGHNKGLFEVSVVDSTNSFEDTPVSGRVDVLDDLKQTITVSLAAISLLQALHFAADRLSSITL